MITEEKSSPIRDRLIALCDELGISRRDFSKSIGKTATYVTSVNNDITSGVLNNILINYPKVNILWIITGKGEMFVTHDPSDALLNYLREENQALKNKNDELLTEIGELRFQIKEIKKRVPQEGNVICADASGSGLVK